ncbi:PriCT-2 domain-containing protein [Aquitalea pelogenes]|uniref:PriCT-2 domain-containing protein n=1 Tax=Aquitalea pelogenes TaxID=1293573 RepID=UPI0035B44884
MEQIANALRYLDPHGRDGWVLHGMAIKSELGEAGFPLWDDWSRTADNYQPKAAKSVWKSIKPGGKVTIASLFAQAIQHGYRPEQPYQPPSAEERAKLEQERADAQAEAEALAALQRQAAKDKAMALWAKGHDVAAEHPYLAAKGIRIAGLARWRCWQPVTPPSFAGSWCAVG